MRIKKLFTAALLTALAAFTAAGSTHTLWINCTDYQPAFSSRAGAKTKIYMGWGHHFPVDSHVNAADFNNITLLTPSQKQQSVALTTTGFASAEMKLAEKGLHLIAVTRREAYNTSYLENGRPVHIKGTKEGKNDVLSSTYSQQFAKALIQAGDGGADNLTHVFGHKLELIPLTNPYELANNTGGVMKIKVLFEGKPLIFTKVNAMYEGYSNNDDYSCSVSTDRNGVASLRIDHWGKWVVKTKVERPAGQALKDKVNQENYFASLTFSVP